MMIHRKAVLALAFTVFALGSATLAAGWAVGRSTPPSLELAIARGTPASKVAPELWQQHFGFFGGIEVTDGGDYLLIEAVEADAGSVPRWMAGAYQIPGWDVRKLVLRQDEDRLTLSLVIVPRPAP